VSRGARSCDDDAERNATPISPLTLRTESPRPLLRGLAFAVPISLAAWAAILAPLALAYLS
jgi:hypothetical protein